MDAPDGIEKVGNKAKGEQAKGEQAKGEQALGEKILIILRIYSGFCLGKVHRKDPWGIQLN
jgi:hypothetical protein